MRSARARSVALTVAVFVAGTTVACSGTGVSSDGGCAGAVLTVEPAPAAPGHTLTVTGESMIKGCEDHVDVDSEGNVHAGDTEATMPDAEIDLVLADDNWVTLAAADADGQGRFTVEVTLPADLAGATSRGSRLVGPTRTPSRSRSCLEAHLVRDEGPHASGWSCAGARAAS